MNFKKKKNSSFVQNQYRKEDLPIDFFPLGRKKEPTGQSPLAWCILMFFYTLSLFFISSCGFLNGGSNSFSSGSQVGDPGDGKTPVLGPRLQESPDLADKECEGNSRCEEACKKIYEDTDSYKECYELTIGEVSKIEEVFHILVESELEDLEDIEEEDLESYIKVGLDGWRDKVIQKQKNEEDRDGRFQNTIHWIVDQEKYVIPVLEKEDQDNEILEEIFLGHCNIHDNRINIYKGRGYECTNNVSPLGDNTDCASSGSTLSFDYFDGYICAGTTKIADIEGKENMKLFLALVAGGGDFFKRAAENRNYSAFVLGNKLVEKACSSRDDTSFDQCVAAFYCHLRDDDYLNRDFFNIGDMTEGVGRTIALKSCGTNYDNFVNIEE
ncbi:MAG: hypothetical protein OXH36_02615 [Bdellovibrionales bacterium]|nr:hypothetical protein [Bdellovibrionales bacterium]